MNKRFLGALAAMSVALMSGVGVVSAATFTSASVTTTGPQSNSVSVSHDNGHVTVVVTAHGKTVVNMDPPFGGP